MTDRPQDQLPEHERRPETDVGGGIAGEGGTAPETRADRRAMDAGLDDEERPQPDSDIDDPDPEDPNGPEAAYQPRSI
jgi:hypothetical protein